MPCWLAGLSIHQVIWYIFKLRTIFALLLLPCTRLKSLTSCRKWACPNVFLISEANYTGLATNVLWLLEIGEKRSKSLRTLGRAFTLLFTLTLKISTDRRTTPPDYNSKLVFFRCYRVKCILRWLSCAWKLKSECKRKRNLIFSPYELFQLIIFTGCFILTDIKENHVILLLKIKKQF